ncbi:ferritin-like domain-containing protein [Mucilaginibacter sp. UR6-11]|uniref:ferritin-like domain-containing protein n=1 Tax=Mucilaginibacter sp. UR6-11 TaxID=1435644 RepID=UPI001E476A65|nr:ferritin-like domain-containing protein [Mucilaginibacter sp. UR6-11]MCC8423394.1 ferritin-like domain-containing protein [Mucilaginibacter sp. UR6-11]
MNLFGIIEEIGKADPEFQDRISPRRDAIKNITGFGSKVAVAAIPFAFSTLFKKAYGQAATVSVTDVLNYALKLEYLEAAFYNAGIAATGLTFSSTERAYLTTIQGHENAHVAFLKSVLGSAAVAQSTQGTNGTYDFTAGGTFPTVLTNVDTFFAVAQAFEDTGVRAYKGAAPSLLGQQVPLTAALNIHSVEARHASAVRQIRRARGAATTKPWITGANDTGIAAVNANYAGEDNLNQGGVTITSLSGVSGNISTNAATECFDEPLTMAQVVALVGPFGVK